MGLHDLHYLGKVDLQLLEVADRALGQEARPAQERAQDEEQDDGKNFGKGFEVEQRISPR